MAQVFRRDGAWWIDYLGPDGRRHRGRTSAPTKELAARLLREKLNLSAKAEALGISNLEAIRSKLFVDFLDEYLTHCKVVHTPSTYARDQELARKLKPVFGHMQLRSISFREIIRYVEARATQTTVQGERIRPATVNRELNFLSATLAEAVRRGYIPSNPARQVKKLPERNDKLRWLTTEEEEKILALAPEFLRPMILLALNTGMRRGEVLALRHEDIKLEQGTVCVANAKNHKTRHVPLNARAVEALRTVPRFCGPDGESAYVFTNPDTHTRYRDIAHTFCRVVRRAGLTDVSFHTLRHTFASRLAQAGVPLNDIREMLGHGGMQMTIRYAHLAPNNLRAAVETLCGASKMGHYIGTVVSRKLASEKVARKSLKAR